MTAGCEKRSAPAAWRIGLDMGSTAAKAVLLDPGGSIVDRAIATARGAPGGTAAGLIAELAGRNRVESPAVAATGYGRSAAGARRTVTEITCHALGVHRLHPDVATILDIGGQDAKAIRIGPAGGVEDFAMNDRCAAGTGSFLEVAAQRYGLGVAELSGFCGDDPGRDADRNAVQVSSTCVVFAASELVGFAADGVSPVEALRAVHRAVARRVLLLLKQVGATAPLYFTGGVAANETLRIAIAQACGMPVGRAESAQFTGALGAALLA